jgi:RNA polymerase sigma-70 factor (ECF subfamily)
MDVKDIISRCLDGEKEAFGMIVDEYQSRLLHFTWSILGDKDEAKDVTQDSFLRSYLRLQSYDPEKSFKTWLYTIAYNRCVDKIREKQSMTRFIKKAQHEQAFPQPSYNPEKNLEDSRHFQAILRRLNKNERTALSLKLNEGYLSRDIAEVLGCKESTVRVYILNAKRKAKKFLEKNQNV